MGPDPLHYKCPTEGKLRVIAYLDLDGGTVMTREEMNRELATNIFQEEDENGYVYFFVNPNVVWRIKNEDKELRCCADAEIVRVPNFSVIKVDLESDPDELEYLVDVCACHIAHNH